MNRCTLVLLALFILFQFGCKNGNRIDATSGDTTKEVVYEAHTDGNSKSNNVVTANDGNPVPGWVNPVVENYIKQSDNELILLARKDSIEETWMFDQIVVTDTAVYVIAQIGHDVAEPDGSEPRYVTDQWLYVDTVSRKIYEFDLPNERLLPWHGR